MISRFVQTIGTLLASANLTLFILTDHTTVLLGVLGGIWIAVIGPRWFERGPARHFVDATGGYIGGERTAPDPWDGPKERG